MPVTRKLHMRSHVRLFLITVCVLIVPLIMLTVVFVYTYRQIYDNEALQAISHEIDSVTTTVDNECKNAAIYLTNLSQDTEMRRYLRAAQDPESAVPADDEALQAAIRRYSSGRPSLLNTRLIVITPGGEAVYGGEYLGSLDGDPAFMQALAESYRSPLKSSSWFYEQQFYEMSEGDAYIFVSCPVTGTSDWQTLGYVVLRFRNSDFVSMYLRGTNSHRSMFALDSFGNVISSVDNLDVRDSILGDANRQLLLVSEPFQTGELLVYSTRLANLWYLVSATDASAATHPQLNMAVTLYAAALLLCVALTLWVSYGMSKRFMRPINTLISNMHQVEQGDLHSRVLIQTHDEFEDLANSYNKMIERLEELMQQIIFEQEQKRESDIRMLQAQISPHFLYNTLASIRCMIYMNQPEDVDRILLALSRFLKYVLSNADTVYVTLGHELEQMNNYITIQQFGFDVPMRCEVDIPGELSRCLIVKMLLQPLIENAILHGLKVNRTDPTLRITATAAEGGMVQIDISDNGSGFDAETLRLSNSSEPPSRHLGIRNVRQRLQLHYGENFRFELISKKGQGTTARIVIPKMTKEGGSIENIDR